MTYLNNNDHDQMGMLAFGDNLGDTKDDVSTKNVVSPKQTPRPTSILGECGNFEFLLMNLGVPKLFYLALLQTINNQ